MFPCLIITLEESLDKTVTVINIDKISEINIEEDNTEYQLSILISGVEDAREFTLYKHQRANQSQSLEFFDTDTSIYIKTENADEIIDIIRKIHFISFKSFSEDQPEIGTSTPAEGANLEKTS